MLQIHHRKHSKGKIKSPQTKAAKQTGCLAPEHALAVLCARLVGNAVSVLANREAGCATGSFQGYRKASRAAKGQLTQGRDRSHQGDFGFTLNPLCFMPATFICVHFHLY